VADIADAQFHQITGAQLAVDAEVEQRQLPGSVRQLQADPDGPDFLRLQRGLLTDELALVPGRACVCGWFVHSMMDLHALSRPAWTRRPGAQGRARCLALARSIFDLPSSAIGHNRWASLIGQQLTFDGGAR
jgi:hypothetical protein